MQLPDGARTFAEVAVFLETDEEPVGVADRVAGGAADRAWAGRRSSSAATRERSATSTSSCSDSPSRRDPAAPLGSAIAALDCALWDLRAKHERSPLWRELGASDGRVAAYASGLDMPLVR